MSMRYDLVFDFTRLIPGENHYAKPAYKQEDILPVKNSGRQHPSDVNANRNHYYGATENTDGKPSSPYYLPVLLFEIFFNPTQFFVNILQGRLLARCALIFARHVSLLHFLTTKLFSFSILPQCSGISKQEGLKGLRPFKTHPSPLSIEVIARSGATKQTKR